MNALIVIAHPNPLSFNYSLLDRVKHNLEALQYEVTVRDLYKLKFNPILTDDHYQTFSQTELEQEILDEQAYILENDLLVFIFPTWWSSLPAILKGYFDRVFTNGFAFTMTKKGLNGQLNDKKAIVIQTTGEPESTVKKFQRVNGSLIDLGILDRCGIEVIIHKFFYSVPYVDPEERREMLDEVEPIIYLLQKQI
jgi:NAD(P)H dehydrogenase (quinone)